MSLSALDSCDWAAPGADRYTGTASAAIHAFATIPEPVRQRLVAKHERRAWDDVVYIDRDAIRGRKEAWDPRIRDMHFGSRGRVCGRVDRSMWSSAQVESAVVYCDSGYCVAWPSVCGNWFVIAPQADRPVALAAAVEPALALDPNAAPDGDEDPAGDADDGPVFPVGSPSAPSASNGGAWSGSAGTGASIGIGTSAATSFAARSGARVAAAPSTATALVTTPIPEPATWAGLFAGLAALAAHRRSLSRR